MTQTGQQNHYNVKFLKGYGFSVNVKTNKIVLMNCYYPFLEPEDVEEWKIGDVVNILHEGLDEKINLELSDFAMKNFTNRPHYQ